MTTNGTTAPLTEEELAEIEAATSEDCLGPYPLACPLEYGEIWGLVADIPRLLADLRRAQKRITDLEAIPTIGPCKCAEPHVVDGLIPACAVCAQPMRILRIVVEESGDA